LFFFLKYLLVLLFTCCSVISATAQPQKHSTFIPASHPYIQYTGRIDFSNPQLPRFWQPGVYVQLHFSGTWCDVIVNDEVLWDKNHNYLEVVVDGTPLRLQSKGKTDTIHAAQNLKPGKHSLLICKNTEANIGYIELVGFRCEKILKPLAKPKRKIECIGNSITCGTGSDMSEVPCGKGVWQDQHNAYMSYGAITARTLQAQYHLSSVSGIGLMYSCCNMDIIMPQVFDKVSMRNNEISWDFKKYQPDAVTICLGQNDGIQDSAIFCNNYIAFLKTLRTYYPRAGFVLLSSPMADSALTAFMKKTITSIVDVVNSNGDKKVYRYFFSRRFTGGCDYHPSLEEHKLIAAELSAALQKIMHW